ncbi:helix-turn-helix domain-containing protein [Niallia taxi]|uniref:XRE family transcriptional regulator n=1 Tax=Niallia taxi TaxID=2499688 RepID=A0A437KA82_9BACI|nr:helix-turn-helix domain-containing protein [Niallia taxi]MCM3216518.1 helix-turn-helix transcriptional regulator [Niallia taxi]MDK8640112.1 helix-turn-helix domain-containing protein [Niallia taxi]MED4039004.1 helix-turn-helix domain-containing protein [Niallia taxi]MED4054080.1 helix-turn-helix domain-containing protein [Niallia taxi]MED4118399.1 helix-turn-helix domain-containing protein [Niallia taxi]
MDFSAVGEKIKELRKQVGLSQKELSHNICTQAQISKIEKGEVLPLSSTLYLISQRLGIDVNYFFDIGTTPRLDYVIETSEQLKAARRNTDYETIKQIVEAEEKNPLFTRNKKHYQILLWHKAIYVYEVDHDFQKALELIDEAIALTFDKVFTEKEIEIFVSRGIFYYEEGFNEEALQIYCKALSQLQKIPHLQDATIKSRLFFNIAKSLTELNKYESSITYCKKGIDWAIKKDNLYLLAHFHYHIGFNYEMQEKFNLASNYMKEALLIFQLVKDTRYTEYIQEKIDGWKEHSNE